MKKVSQEFPSLVRGAKSVVTGIKWSWDEAESLLCHLLAGDLRR